MIDTFNTTLISVMVSIVEVIYCMTLFTFVALFRCYCIINTSGVIHTLKTLCVQFCGNHFDFHVRQHLIYVLRCF